MTFRLAPELVEFGTQLAALLEREIDSTYVRRALRDGEFVARSFDEKDQKVWGELYSLGCFDAVIPEKLGGLGFGVSAAAMIVQEASQRLLPLPLTETIIFGILPLSIFALEADLQKLLTGQLKVSGSFTALMGPVDEAATLRASPSSSSSGVKSTVLKGLTEPIPSLSWAQEIFLVAKVHEGQLALVRVIPSSTGCNISSCASLDLVRSFAALECESIESEILIEAPETDSRWAMLRAAALVITSAELIGCARMCFNLALGYSKTREQFGKPIGTFQAIQHKLADAYLVVEQLEALIAFVAQAIDDNSTQAVAAAYGLKAFASEAVAKLIESTLQIHGGIGFTFEYDLHLALRRALVMSEFLGGSAHYAELLCASYEEQHPQP